MISKLRGRSSRELAFRTSQELANASMYLWAPSAGGKEFSGSLSGLPDPKHTAAHLQNTPYAKEVDRLATQIMAHQFPLLGLSISTGAEIEWRKDYPNNKTSRASYMRRVPYLDFAAVGDHKNVWELNRHQHLVLLAQAYLIHKKKEYLAEIVLQLESWFTANRFMRGINWTSALEVAFRALSWTWIWHLVSSEMDPKFRKKFLTGIYQHGCYLEYNLSIYFSANTHLLGESVTLYTLGTLFPDLPRSEKWKATSSELVLAAMQKQVQEDGSHFEQSTYYHVYALDMFAFYLVLDRQAPKEYRERLGRMAEYLNALLGPLREITCFGDDDGGRFFHPYGVKVRYGRASLALAAQLLHKEFCYEDEDAHELAYWWLGPTKNATTIPPFSGSQVFKDAGMAVYAQGGIEVYLKYGPMAPEGAGHSHADLLSLTVRDNGQVLLIDPGTFTYVGDPQWRDWFRGTAAHNTVTINGLNQATPAGPFRWMDKPESALESENPLTVSCCYHDFLHRRRLIWRDRTTLIITDEISGPPGEHEISQNWHSPLPMPMHSPACFQLGSWGRLWANPDTSREYGEGGQIGWMSPVFGVREVASALRVVKRGSLPIRLVTVLDFEGRYTEWQPEWNRA